MSQRHKCGFAGEFANSNVTRNVTFDGVGWELHPPSGRSGCESRAPRVCISGHLTLIRRFDSDPRLQTKPRVRQGFRRADEATVSKNVSKSVGVDREASVTGAEFPTLHPTPARRCRPSAGELAVLTGVVAHTMPHHAFTMTVRSSYENARTRQRCGASTSNKDK